MSFDPQTWQLIKTPIEYLIYLKNHRPHLPAHYDTICRTIESYHNEEEVGIHIYSDAKSHTSSTAFNLLIITYLPENYHRKLVEKIFHTSVVKLDEEAINTLCELTNKFTVYKLGSEAEKMLAGTVISRFFEDYNDNSDSEDIKQRIKIFAQGRSVLWMQGVSRSCQWPK